MSVITLATLDTDFEDAKSGVASIIRLMTRVTAGGVLCLVDHNEDDLATAIIEWLSEKQLRVMLAQPAPSAPSVTVEHGTRSATTNGDR